MEEFKKFIIDIARQAGNIAFDYWQKVNSIETFSKGFGVDVVTEADYSIEQFLRNKIIEKYPTHSIIGEEDANKIGDNYKWLIDPIDGTVSFLHGQYHWGISIALKINDETVLGVLNCPAYNLFFFSQKGKGATLNGDKISPSAVKNLSNACVCTGFCCIRSQWEANNLKIFNDMAKNVQGIRRLGSIATDIAFVACGKLDACWEMNVNIYDVAAALLIAEEAGAVVSDMKGTDTYLPSFPLVTNRYLKKQMLNIFNNHIIPFENGVKK